MSIESENVKQKEVYAYAGLALHWAQCFEKSVENIILISSKCGDISISLKQLESLEEDIERKTLGALLRIVKNYVSFSNEEEKIICDALEKRNYLAHCFFKDQAETWYLNDGAKMLSHELQEIVNLLRMADTIASTLMYDLGKAIGLTLEMVDAELERTVQTKRTEQDAELKKQL